MAIASQSRSERFVVNGGDEESTFARDVIQGLSRPAKSLSPKYFYDAAGSALFDRICLTPEYYVTRTEKRILREHAPHIAGVFGSDVDIVEFGAGSLDKVRILLDLVTAVSSSVRYVPVDISREHLQRSSVALQAVYPDLDIEPVVADFTSNMVLPDGRRRVGFFPGSTLGNFAPEDAIALLRRFAENLKGGGLLLGIDLIKDPAMLHAAYNDASGATADFNLNILRRANNELGADFNIHAFYHHACYRPDLRRMEMHLISTKRQVVSIGKHRFSFDEGESIHTESSYKYSDGAVVDLARAAGFKAAASWSDPDRLFAVYWLESP